MEELNDKDFDQIFKNRIKDGYLEYEEESWLKMEKKLRSRNRFVFLRNASIVLLFLSFGLGAYLMSGDDKNKSIGDEKLAIEVAKPTKSNKGMERVEKEKTLILEKNSTVLRAYQPKSTRTSISIEKRTSLVQNNSVSTIKEEIITTAPASTANQSTAIANATVVVQDQMTPQNTPIQVATSTGGFMDVNVGKAMGEAMARREKAIAMTRPGIALSLLIGPDFNSTENAVGGKSGFAVGIGISVPLIKKLSIQTGLNYGAKNYEAEGYDYTFSNPNIANIIAGIEASCKVLEIPLRASYTLMNNSKNSIDLNAGLSSYLMLKENYRFIYTSSARRDRFLEEKNANQHYLSVIDLSATYNIKLKNQKFALGIQPYIKIPLSGIGEGGVPLKSSGISLKLNYELNKKN